MTKIAITKYLSGIGKKGGSAKGKSKVRGDSEYYRRLAAAKKSKTRPFNAHDVIAEALTDAIIKKNDQAARDSLGLRDRPTFKPHGKFKRPIA